MMVLYVVDSFETILEHYERCKMGSYQCIEIEDGKVVLKIRAGSLAYEKVFDSWDDEDLVKKLEVLKARGFLEVTRVVNEDSFFR